MLITAISFLIISMLLQLLSIFRPDLMTPPLEKTAFRSGTYGSILIALSAASTLWPDLWFVFDGLGLAAIVRFILVQIELAYRMWKGFDHK